VGKKEWRNLRMPSHKLKFPDFPDPEYYLSYTQNFYFRHESLRHLRVEQYVRYLAQAGEPVSAEKTQEDTISDTDDAPEPDLMHRNYDRYLEDDITSGSHFKSSVPGLPGCKRRTQMRLGVPRVAFIEPIGTTREDFYECRGGPKTLSSNTIMYTTHETTHNSPCGHKLVLGLAWYCPEKPEVKTDEQGHQHTIWQFRWDPPPPEDLDGAVLGCETLKLGGEHSVSFEMMCNRLEAIFCSEELNLVCKCCAGELHASPCQACRYAVGWHQCRLEGNDRTCKLWRKGTLHAGVLDVQRVPGFSKTLALQKHHK